MMTKWDSIQMDILPIEPKYWGDEEEFEKDLSLDEIMENEELENELTLDWNE